MATKKAKNISAKGSERFQTNASGITVTKKGGAGKAQAGKSKRK